MANRYVFDSELTGFINIDKPSGKYNNMTLSFIMPPDVVSKAESDREELLTWAKTKVDNPKRVAVNPPKWDDEGLVKYSFGGDTPRPAPVFVDTNGDPLPEEVRRSVARGTKVRVIADQTPYTKPAMGTTIKVKGIQVVELVTMNGASDSGDLSVQDIADLFGKTSGFTADSPNVRDARPTEASSEYGGSLDF
jgi:hypothetical protein